MNLTHNISIHLLNDGEWKQIIWIAQRKKSVWYSYRVGKQK